MMLDEINKRLREAEARAKQIDTALAKKAPALAERREPLAEAFFAAYERVGKTLGIQIPDDLREVLEVVQERHGLKSLKHTAIVCLRVGAATLAIAKPRPKEARDGR